MPDLSALIIGAEDLDERAKIGVCSVYGIKTTVGDVLAKSPEELRVRCNSGPVRMVHIVGWLLLRGYDIKGEWWLYGQLLLQDNRVRSRIGIMTRSTTATPAIKAYCKEYKFDYLEDRARRRAQASAEKRERAHARRLARA